MQTAVNPDKAEQSFRDTLLKAVPKFPQNAICELAQVSVPRRYNRGTAIIREGEPSGGMFLLVAGTVQGWMSGPSAFDDNDIAVTQISAPAVLGMTSCMLGDPSAFSMSASSPAEAVFIPQDHVLRVLRHFPAAGLAMSELISEELAQTYAHLSKLRSASTSNRPSLLLN